MEKKKILVTGGGISGITSAVELAETGHEVVLVEKLPYLGGRVAQTNQYFPKLCPPYCGLEINFRRIRQNIRIQVHISTLVDEITGEQGNFKVRLKKSPEYINNNCTCCGECEKACPVSRPNPFNYNLDNTKAIYLPHEMAFPSKYHIDMQYCRGNECKKCVEVCKYNAINLNANEEQIEIQVDSIVMATGWKPYEAERIDNLGFGKYKNVVTNVMMERIAAPNGANNAKILRPSDSKEPKTIAFVQCAGSRDENHLPYCSAVCCSASLKQALFSKELIKDIKIKIYYIDLRVSGRGEDFLKRVKNEENIYLIKGKAAKVFENKENQNLIIEVEDIMSGKKIKDEVEMLVLAIGIVPETLSIKGLDIGNADYFGEVKLIEGINFAGCAKKPLDVSASLKDATGAALKSIQHKKNK